MENLDLIKNSIKEEMRKSSGVMKTADLYEKCGLTYYLLDRLVKEEFLRRIKNGYYSVKDEEHSEEEILGALFPDGVLCMQSALYAYGYLKEKPFAYHIAIDKNTSKSRFVMDYPVVVPYYTEPSVLSLGVTGILIDGINFKIYDRDRLMVDILKYEKKLERDEFKSALANYIIDEKKNVDNLIRYAKERKVYKKVETMLGVWL
ncbi:MAG: hypothetical protein IJR23_01825 [Lachnospiraceae bacterium]|nr:hypothetical protein [Lachnospiraceae bacterium]